MPARQRAFIAQLARIGVVSAAARAVGMSRKSAYALHARAGQGSAFRRAWDMALWEGKDRAHDLAIDRAVHGYTITRTIVRGAVSTVSTEHRHDNRLIAAALGPGFSTRPRGGQR